MEIIYAWCAGVELGLCALIDGYKRLVPCILIIAFVVIGIGLRIYDMTLFSVEMLYSLLPGIVILLIGFVTGEGIGYGDGLLVLSLGLYLSIAKLGAVLMMAITMSGIVALILFVLFQKEKSFEIPFIPFVLLGYLLMLCIG